MSDVGQYAEAVAGGLGRGPLIPVSPFGLYYWTVFETGLFLQMGSAVGVYELSCAALWVCTS